MGLGAQGHVWDEEMLLAFVDRGFFAIRFDNRAAAVDQAEGIDAGVVTAGILSAFGGQTVEAPYVLADLAADAVSLLDHLGIESAHVVGASMGGMIVQQMVIDHPARVRSVTSIMSTTGDRDVGQPDRPSPLPAPAAAASRGRGDRERRRGRPGDQQPGPLRRRSGSAPCRGLLRPLLLPEGVSHQPAVLAAVAQRGARLGAPALVIHGDSDPLVTPSGGRHRGGDPRGRAARAGGHGPRPAAVFWPTIIESVTKLAARSAAWPDRRPPRMSTETSTDGRAPRGVQDDRDGGHRARGPSAPWSWPTSAPRSSGSTVRRAPPAATPTRPRPTCSTGAGDRAPDLKHPDGVATVLELVAQADALIEGFRPGVMERLGLGPDAPRAQPEARVRRMTGWGQEGPYAYTAGHDINYIALSGAPRPGRPQGSGLGAPAEHDRRLRWRGDAARAGICAAPPETGRPVRVR